MDSAYTIDVDIDKKKDQNDCIMRNNKVDTFCVLVLKCLKRLKIEQIWYTHYDFPVVILGDQKDSHNEVIMTSSHLQKYFLGFVQTYSGPMKGLGIL